MGGKEEKLRDRGIRNASLGFIRADLDQNIGEAVHPSPVAGIDQGGGVRLLNDGRAGELKPHRQRLPLVNRNVSMPGGGG